MNWAQIDPNQFLDALPTYKEAVKKTIQDDGQKNNFRMFLIDNVLKLLPKT
jgi:hypothetical protein